MPYPFMSPHLGVHLMTHAKAQQMAENAPLNDGQAPPAVSASVDGKGAHVNVAVNQGSVVGGVFQGLGGSVSANQNGLQGSVSVDQVQYGKADLRGLKLSGEISWNEAQEVVKHIFTQQIDCVTGGNSSPPSASAPPPQHFSSNQKAMLAKLTGNATADTPIGKVDANLLVDFMIDNQHTLEAQFNEGVRAKADVKACEIRFSGARDFASAVGSLGSFCGNEVLEKAGAAGAAVCSIFEGSAAIAALGAGAPLTALAGPVWG
uniref:Uncharacterized protein n=1 Tax=Chromera velia CCMP2878 TaxID=1169474 RepID=A0A0G4I300_9ALVE|eukprot:Cvel_10544.t1-p1 / transcript=Cvel_10544.t1 / gene=Cvel_10544 / organism=Chromera_velia_CCMP2878 / gene_product=hypothetical protein / transcript_product=hypothetical protein / location=Cvel_scaffold638:45589-46371(-) / protein_length=261 / sequence_SO=supercontig / SO=protein_coding / is_pseudo=false